MAIGSVKNLLDTRPMSATRDKLKIAIVGTGWITRPHLHGLISLNHIDPLKKEIELTSLHSRTAETTKAMAEDFEFKGWTTRWEDAIEDDSIDVVGVLTANGLHYEVTKAALAAGKTVMVEKPLTEDSNTSWELAELGKSKNILAATAFNYRYLSATRAMWDLFQSGDLGELHHFRANYLQDWAMQDSSKGIIRSHAPSTLDYSHIVDHMLRFAGMPETIAANMTSFGTSPEDDAFSASIKFKNGATGTLEASRYSMGWKGNQRIEINGSKGSVWWNMEDPNMLHLFLKKDQDQGYGGFRSVLMSEANHPFTKGWWTPGHVYGWEHSFAHQWRAFLNAHIEGRSLDPYQASLVDGARVADVCEAIHQSAKEERHIKLVDRK